MRRLITIILILIITCSLCICVHAQDLTELQEKSSQLTQAIDESNNRLQAVQDELSTNMQELQDLDNKIAQSQEELNTINTDIDDLMKQINENESIDVITFKRLQKQQEEFHKRLLELEVKDLEREIDSDVRKKIDEGKILENVIPEQRKDTYDSLYNSYYEFLLKTEKYSKLKQYKSDKKE